VYLRISGLIVGLFYVIIRIYRKPLIGHWVFVFYPNIVLFGAFHGYWLYIGTKLGLFGYISGHQLPNTEIVMGTSYWDQQPTGSIQSNVYGCVVSLFKTMCVLVSWNSYVCARVVFAYFKTAYVLVSWN
jgi:hypothetical protein